MKSSLRRVAPPAVKLSEQQDPHSMRTKLLRVLNPEEKRGQDGTLLNYFSRGIYRSPNKKPHFWQNRPEVGHPSWSS
jgi:hypothetical protein